MPLSSDGTRVALDGSLTVAATKAGNLASATPTLGARSCGHAVQQCVDQPSFATVQALKAVQPDIGSTQLRSLHPVADPLQEGENLCEYPAVVRLLGFED